MNEIPKILIVDDIKAVHLMYTQALQEENYEILHAVRGKEAVIMILTNNIDLVLLDLKLPDISGLQVLEEIRKVKIDLPVIIITSYATQENVKEASKLKIIDYFVKPVDLDLLKERIREILKIPANKKLYELEAQSRRILEEILKTPVDYSIGKEIADLKNEIKLIASKIYTPIQEKVIKNNLDDALWKKEVKCPVCANNFITYNYKNKSFPVIKKESDFHEIYEIMNPLVFDIWVCPKCLYSAKKDDFSQVDSRILEKLAVDKVRRKITAGDIDFNIMRNYDSGIMSYRLAIMCYEFKKGTTNAFIGSLYLKAAWLAREKEDNVMENELLRKVVDYYEKSLSQCEKISGQLSELGTIYLIGEIYRRLGDIDKASKYFLKVRQDPEAKNEKAILRMANEQFEMIREEKLRLNEIEKEKLKNIKKVGGWRL